MTPEPQTENRGAGGRDGDIHAILEQLRDCEGVLPLKFGMALSRLAKEARDSAEQQTAWGHDWERQYHELEADLAALRAERDAPWVDADGDRDPVWSEESHRLATTAWAKRAAVFIEGIHTGAQHWLDGYKLGLAKGRVEPREATRNAVLEVERGSLIASHNDVVTLLEAERQSTAALRDVGIPCELFCPECGHQHVDAPEPEIGWTNPPHRTHKCHACDHLWRPYPVATFGVESTTTAALRARVEALGSVLRELLDAYAEMSKRPTDYRNNSAALLRVRQAFTVAESALGGTTEKESWPKWIWCQDCEEERLVTFDWRCCQRCQNKLYRDAYTVAGITSPSPEDREKPRRAQEVSDEVDSVSDSRLGTATDSRSGREGPSGITAAEHGGTHANDPLTGTAEKESAGAGDA